MSVTFSRTPNFMYCNIKPSSCASKKRRMVVYPYGEGYVELENGEYFESVPDGAKVSRETIDDRAERIQSIVLRRAKRNIIELCDCNPFRYFGTVTIRDSVLESDVDSIFNRFLSAMAYFKKVCPDFIYLAVAEHGSKSGRLHFHLVLGGDISRFLTINKYGYLDCPYLFKRFGFVSLAEIGSTDEDSKAVSLYCSKYITKDSVRFKGSFYHCSRGLTRASSVTVNDNFLSNYLFGAFHSLDDSHEYSFMNSYSYCFRREQFDSVKSIVADALRAQIKAVSVFIDNLPPVPRFVWDSHEYFDEYVMSGQCREDVASNVVKHRRNCFRALNKFFEVIHYDLCFKSCEQEIFETVL